ncbi:MAG TPA: UDP-N-acetylmuramoyl-tripeptide--D-alanyl-D-alanine ligase [Actinomycetota bacterium]|nr:UDP-N-acetylmuramoyl-tripeptide--D-alanyl-D-alanine ligase [Actinomycetota bacterium]
MIPMTLAEVAAAIGGTLHGADGELVIDAVVTDSRTAAAGGLFIAVVGQTHDGHDHVRAAVAAGCTAAVVSRPVDAPHILVDDTVGATGRLARAVVDRCPGLRIVAVTGSSGKTSTKDLLRVVLTHFGPTVAPQGSFNNELGLPRTVFEVTRETRFLVSEMGARGSGHIRYLCGITPPHAAVLLNVGQAHLSEFGDQDGVARAKAEIVTGLRPDGVAVLNADDPRVLAAAGLAPGRVVTFGQAPTADVRITALDLEQGRPVVTLRHTGTSVTVRPALHGEHQGRNVAAAVAAAVALGLDFAQAALSLQGAALDSRWRMEVRETPDGVTVINDAYNANPESMSAGLRALAEMGRGRRTWAVLGEMRELGPTSTAEHDAIGRLCVRLNISRLIAVGPGARPIHMGAAHEGSWGEESMAVADVAEALAVLREQVRPGDVVLVKASRAEGLERVAAGLLGEAQ